MLPENASTQNAVLEIAANFDPQSGTALVCALENQNLLSRTPLAGKRVLEIGCGTLPASFGIPDDAMPATYLATDVSSDLVEAARHNDPRPAYQVETAEALTIESGSFDLIIMRGVLHHLADPAGALRGLRRCLRPGGELLLYEPNLSCIPANAAKWVLWRFFHVNMEESPYGQLSQKTIRAAIKDAGFEVADVWYTSLLAFPLSGDYGRRPILPNSVGLFRGIVALDRFLSRMLHALPWLAAWTHFRVVFLLRRPPVP